MTFEVGLALTTLAVFVYSMNNSMKVDYLNGSDMPKVDFTAILVLIFSADKF